MSPSSLLGAADEHYVMSQLLRRGFIAALAPVGVPLANIVVTDDVGKASLPIRQRSTALTTNSLTPVNLSRSLPLPEFR
jgi:hypothetical protein